MNGFASWVCTGGAGFRAGSTDWIWGPLDKSESCECSRLSVYQIPMILVIRPTFSSFVGDCSPHLMGTLKRICQRNNMRRKRSRGSLLTCKGRRPSAAPPAATSPCLPAKTYDYELTGTDGVKLAVELFRLVESEGNDAGPGIRKIKPSAQRSRARQATSTIGD